MDESAWFLRLVSIFLLFMVPLVHGGDVCVQDTPCSCVFPNRTWIDLSPSAKNSTFVSATSYTQRNGGGLVRLTTFYYHPCRDILMDIAKNCSGNCNVNVPASVSRHEAVWNQSAPDTLTKIYESYDVYGTSSKVEFAPDGSYIKYLNPPSSTTVHLVCANSDDQLDIKDLSNPSATELQFVSRNACLNGGNTKMVFTSWANTSMFYLLEPLGCDMVLGSDAREDKCRQKACFKKCNSMIPHLN